MTEVKIEKQNIREFLDESGEERVKWRERYSYYHRLMEEYVKFIIPKNLKVLEFGSLAGHQLAALEPEKGLGIDLSEKSVEIAKKNFYDEPFDEKGVWLGQGTGPMSDSNQALPWIVFVRDTNKFKEMFPNISIKKYIFILRLGIL